MQMITEDEKLAFQAEVLNYYYAHGRHDLPWRLSRADQSFDPYAIMVSEIMLQQTQVTRVVDKFKAFLEQFPTISSLAAAPLSEVLILWSGLGYNRRAKFLHQAAQCIQLDHRGVFPDTLEELVSLPGIGKNTAGAILTYAYDQPVVFIETNIRTVYLAHFFIGHDKVSDAELLELVSETLDGASPRIWYWALMDYGSFVKREQGNPNIRSRHYSKQTKFEGSNRQIRGQVLRMLAAHSLTHAELSQEINDQRLDDVLEALLKEEMISLESDHFSL
jgi:A/G-specific adenine glycosylase